MGQMGVGSVEIELLVMREGKLVLCTLDMASTRWQKNYMKL
jgi:hypothetical protein